MPESGTLAQDTTIQIEEPRGSATYVEIEEVLGWTGPGGERTRIPVTHLKSPAIERRAGLKDEGDFRIRTNWRPKLAGQALLLSRVDDELLSKFQIIYNDEDPRTTQTFEANVLSYIPTGDTNDRVTGDAVCAISGEVETV